MMVVGLSPMVPHTSTVVSSTDPAGDAGALHVNITGCAKYYTLALAPCRRGADSWTVDMQ